MDVRLPDGTIIANVPDGTTRADLVAKMRNNGMTVPPEWVTPAQAQTTLGQDIKQGAGNLLAGAVRGAGSIGATLLSPIDAAARAMNDGKPISIGGYEIAGQDRRAGMDGGLQEMGADPNSGLFKTGKLTTEIAGTAGAGGAAANVLSKVAPGAAAAVPNLVQALRTGGMSANGAGVGTRVAGGALNGGLTAGMVNPDDALTGAAIGAVAPSAIKLGGEAGGAINAKASNAYSEALSKFNRQAPARDTLREAVGAGYVVPPNLVNPSAKNAIIESFSGKQATSQLASVRNQDVTEKLVRQSLGLADDAPLTKSALEQIRKVEGGAYKRVASLSPKAEMDLEALKQARNEAQGWFNAYNRSASPEDLAKAKNFRDTAEVLELQLESHAKDAGQDQLVPALRAARKQIAKTYTVERALNDTTGVNAKVIGRLYDKGKPLSDGLDVVGKFASGFPSVNQASQQMGSPAAHNLRAMASLAMGLGGNATMGPMGLAAAAAPFVTGPLSRSLMFRKGAQEALTNAAAPEMGKTALLAQLLQNPEAQMMLARAAPVAISSNQR